MNVVGQLLVGVVLGFSLAAPPGPMNALIAAEAAQARSRGMLTGLGAMSSDGVLGGVIFEVAQVVPLRAYVRLVYIVGAGVMAYFAARILRSSPPVGQSLRGVARTYSAALGLGLSNPFQILWWLTAGLAFAYLGGLVLFIGLFGAIGAWIVAFPWAVHAGTAGSDRARRTVTVVAGILMAAFAVYFGFLAA